MKIFNAQSGELVKKEDYSKVVVFDKEAFRDKAHLVQVATIYPQTKQRLHFHEVQTTALYILEGEGVLFINNQEYTLKKGDAVMCEPMEKHYFWNKTDKDFTFLVLKINLPEKDDTHWEN